MLTFSKLPSDRLKKIDVIYEDFVAAKSKYGFSNKLGFVSLYTTLNCPYKCIHCHSQEYSSYCKVDNSTEELLEIINKLALISDRIQLTGGEVMFRKERKSGLNDLPIILSEIKRRNKEIIFQTTGYKFTPEIISMLKHNNVIWISLSLDGPDSDSNELIRKSKDFYSDVTSLIPILKSLGFKLKVGTVITSINKDKKKLLVLAKQLDELKVDKWKLMQFYPRIQGRASNKNSEKLQVSNIEFNALIKFLKSNSVLQTTELITQNYFDYSKNPALLVLPNGNITVTSGVDDILIGNALLFSQVKD